MIKIMSFKKAAFVAAVAVLGGVLFTQPAFAQDTLYFRGAQGQVDNHPGNGAAGWVWAWAGQLEWGYRAATLEYKLSNGTNGELYVNRGQSASKSLGSSVTAARLCVSTNYRDGYYCTDWRYYA
jgi:hypothetical protein